MNIIFPEIDEGLDNDDTVILSKPLEWTYKNGEPGDYSKFMQVEKDAAIMEVEPFPGVYIYHEYCLNNLLVQGALQQMKLLYDFGTSNDSHFVEMSTFRNTLQTLHWNWH